MQNIQIIAQIFENMIISLQNIMIFILKSIIIYSEIKIKRLDKST